MSNKKMSNKELENVAGAKSASANRIPPDLGGKCQLFKQMGHVQGEYKCFRCVSLQSESLGCGKGTIAVCNKNWQQFYQ